MFSYIVSIFLSLATRYDMALEEFLSFQLTAPGDNPRYAQRTIAEMFVKSASWDARANSSHNYTGWVTLNGTLPSGSKVKATHSFSKTIELLAGEGDARLAPVTTYMNGVLKQFLGQCNGSDTSPIVPIYWHSHNTTPPSPKGVPSAYVIAKQQEIIPLARHNGVFPQDYLDIVLSWVQGFTCLPKESSGSFVPTAYLTDALIPFLNRSSPSSLYTIVECISTIIPRAERIASISRIPFRSLVEAYSTNFVNRMNEARNRKGETLSRKDLSVLMELAANSTFNSYECAAPRIVPGCFEKKSS